MTKRLQIIIVFFISIMAFPSVSAFASDEEEYDIQMHEEDGDNIQDLNPDGRRSPKRPAVCIITKNQIVFGTATTEILTYEIWDDTEDFCLYTFSDPSQFLTIFFNLQGDYRLRLLTRDKTYFGYVSIF